MRKKLTGYTAQARWYAKHLEQQNGEWLQLGWTRVNERLTKPVFRASDGSAVYILDDPLKHLVVHVTPCETPIVHDETDLFNTK